MSNHTNTQLSEPQVAPCPFCHKPVKAIRVTGVTETPWLVGCDDAACPASDISCSPERWNNAARASVAAPQGDALDRIQQAVDAASDERYQSLREWEQLAERWKNEGDMYGWNFHQGMIAGANYVDIYYHRVTREVTALRKEAAAASPVSPSLKVEEIAAGEQDVDYSDPVSLLEKAMRTTMEIECDCERESGACDGECVGARIWQLIHRARKLIKATPVPPSDVARQAARDAARTLQAEGLLWSNEAAAELGGEPFSEEAQVDQVAAIITRYLPVPVEEGDEDRCPWTLDDSNDGDFWETGCGEAFRFTDGGPTDNKFVFCYKCGKRISAGHYSDDAPPNSASAV